MIRLSPGGIVEEVAVPSRMPAPAGPGTARAPLPCLNSNNYTEPLLTGGQRRTAYALTQNVGLMVQQYGVERVGFLTLTFRDHVTDIREAQRRYRSLQTHVLSERYADCVCVVERQKSGRIHFHLLIALAVDIRTGFDFEAIARSDYRSANSWLRAEWAFWRTTAPQYGFGRTELMPVKSTAEGIAKYVGKYIAKHIDSRRDDDKGARLVRYSNGSRRCGTRFAWTGAKSKLWRKKLAAFATRHGCWSMDMLRERYGAKWSYRLAEYIAAEVVT